MFCRPFLTVEKAIQRPSGDHVGPSSDIELVRVSREALPSLTRTVHRSDPRFNPLGRSTTTWRLSGDQLGCAPIPIRRAPCPLDPTTYSHGLSCASGRTKATCSPSGEYDGSIPRLSMR